MSSTQDLSRLDAIEKALLNRWPESRIAPTLERISALADYLGSPQLSYPTISHLPGELALANACRTISSSSFVSPANTSTAARAVAALLA